MRKDMRQYEDVVDIVHKDDETLRFRIDQDDFDKDGAYPPTPDAKPVSFKAAGFRMTTHYDGSPFKPRKAAEPKAEPKAETKADEKK